MSINIGHNTDMLYLPRGVSRKYAIDAITRSIELLGDAMLYPKTKTVKHNLATHFSIKAAGDDQWLREPLVSLHDAFNGNASILQALNSVLDHVIAAPITVAESKREIKLVYTVLDTELSCILNDASHYNLTAKKLRDEVNQMMTPEELIDYLVRDVILGFENDADNKLSTDSMLLLGEILFNQDSPYTIGEVIHNFFQKYGFDLEHYGLTLFEIYAEVSDSRYGDFYHSAVIACSSDEALRKFLANMPDHIDGKGESDIVFAAIDTTSEAPINGMQVLSLYPANRENYKHYVVLPAYCATPSEDIDYATLKNPYANAISIKPKF